MDKVQKHNSFNSQRMFIVGIVYFVIDSVRKLLDTLSYLPRQRCYYHHTEEEKLFQNGKPSSRYENPSIRITTKEMCVFRKTLRTIAL
jgi:hypothetical protein